MMRRTLAAVLVLACWGLLAPAALADDDFELRVERATTARDFEALKELYDARYPTAGAADRAWLDQLVKEKKADEIHDLILRHGNYVNGISRPIPEWKPAERSTVKRLEKYGVTLRRTVGGEEDNKPALLSYEHNFVDDDDIFTARFALAWRHPNTHSTSWDGRTFWYPYASVSGVLTSENEDLVDDAWVFRAGAEGHREPFEPAGSTRSLYRWEWWWRIAGKYELSQDRKARKALVEAAIEPSMDGIGMGYIHRCGKCAPLSFQWRPRAFLEVGRTIKKGGSSEVDDIVLRYGGSIRAELYLDGLSRWLGIWDIYGDEGAGDIPWFLPYLWVENTIRYTPRETREWRNIFAAGLSIPFSKNVSIEVEYRRGRDVPKFEKVEIFTLGIGIKF